LTETIDVIPRSARDFACGLPLLHPASLTPARRLNLATAPTGRLSLFGFRCSLLALPSSLQRNSWASARAESRIAKAEAPSHRAKSGRIGDAVKSLA